MPSKKAKQRKVVGKKKSEGTVSRRDVLKIGAAAGAVTVLAPTMLTSRKALAALPAVPEPDLVACRATPPVNSPATTPFRDTFKAPFPAIPQNLNPAPTKARNHSRRRGSRASTTSVGTSFFPTLNTSWKPGPGSIPSTRITRRRTSGASTASTRRRRS